MYIVKEAYITMPWLSIYLLEHYFKILNGKDINPHSWQVTPAVSTENFLDTVKQKYKLDFKQCGAFDVMVNLFIFKSLQNKKYQLMILIHYLQVVQGKRTDATLF